MTGGRYIDWTHIRVSGGDRAAAAPYIEAGRKLLGAVWDDAEFNSLGSHKLRQVLPDGTVIVAEKIGSIPRITIELAPGGAPPPPELTPDDFVVWARDDQFPVGIDAVFPQQILRTGWTTFFHDSDIEGYVDFDGEKGTYVGLFPDGVRHAGNLDWTDARGERLSWYGPSTRYWMEPYVQPAAQYGVFVFQLGQVVLDIGAYLDALTPESQDPGFTERWVLGAAKRGRWLYVIHAGVFQYNTAPAQFPSKQGVVIDPIQGDTSDVVLSRFFLAGDAPFLTVVGDSREELWRQTRANNLQPWFFDQECRQAVCHALPASSLFSLPLTPIVPTATTNARLQLDIAEDGVSVTFAEVPLSLATEPGTAAAIATDFTRAGPVELQVQVEMIAAIPGTTTPVKSAVLVLGEARYPLYEPRRRGAFEDGFVYRQLVFADLRGGILVFLRTSDWLTTSYEQAEVVLEVWRHDARVHEAPVPVVATEEGEAWWYALGLDPIMTPASDYTLVELLRQPTIAPLLVLFGIFLEVYRIEAGFNYFFPTFRSAHVGFKFLTRPAADWFGLYKPGKRFGGDPEELEPAILVRDCARASPSNTQDDFDGHRSVCACASNKEVVLLSLSLPHDTNALSPPFAMHHVTGRALPDLTGVAEANARFHPLWRLGAPPLG